MNNISRRSFIPMIGTMVIGASCLSVSKEEQVVSLPSMVFPKPLSEGDTIGIAASAGPIREVAEVEEFTEVLHQLGFKVKIAPHVYQQYGYLAGTDEVRAREFMELIQDDEVNGIFFIRGGWGCARLLPLLDFKQILRHPKVIMGFSDMTTLLNAISHKTGLVTFHGPGGNATWNDYSVGYIKRLLMHGERIRYQNKQGDLPIKTYNGGKAAGMLFGGNLSVLCGLMGSEYIPDWKDKILFLEDVAEEPYRIDRMLNQLSLSGVFDRVAGIVLGNFKKCVPEEPERSFSLEEVFEQHFLHFGKPVFYGAQIGHVRNKFTVPVGMWVEMDADQGTIHIGTSAVRKNSP